MNLPISKHKPIVSTQTCGAVYDIQTSISNKRNGNARPHTSPGEVENTEPENAHRTKGVARSVARWEIPTISKTIGGNWGNPHDAEDSKNQMPNGDHFPF